jgi:hypothetical protein
MTARLVYLSSSQVPFRAANSVQVMRMAAAFAGEGLAVTLWHEAGDAALGDPFAWYGVEPRFALRRYPDRKSGSRLRRRAGRLARRLADATLPAYLGLALRPRVVYGRSLPQIARWLRSPWARHARTGLELHVPPERPALLDQLRGATASSYPSGLVAIPPRPPGALPELREHLQPAWRVGLRQRVHRQRCLRRTTFLINTLPRTTNRSARRSPCFYEISPAAVWNATRCGWRGDCSNGDIPLI